MTMNIVGRRPPRYIEQQRVHVPLVAHIRRRAVPGLVWFHPANGAHYASGSRQGALMAAMGVRPGTSDLVFLHERQFYALELKRAKGGRTEAEQKLFIDDVIKAGGRAAIAHGLDDALAILEAWGLIRGATAFALDLPLPEPRERLMPRSAVHRLTKAGVARLALGTSASAPRRISIGRQKQLPAPKDPV
jgi:hypothetical protein